MHGMVSEFLLFDVGVRAPRRVSAGSVGWNCSSRSHSCVSGMAFGGVCDCRVRFDPIDALRKRGPCPSSCSRGFMHLRDGTGRIGVRDSGSGAYLRSDLGVVQPWTIQLNLKARGRVEPWRPFSES